MNLARQLDPRDAVLARRGGAALCAVAAIASVMIEVVVLPTAPLAFVVSSSPTRHRHQPQRGMSVRSPRLKVD